MIEKWNILVLGDEEKAAYHPLSRVLPGIRTALEPIGELQVCAEEYGRLLQKDLEAYDVIVSYLDCMENLNGFDNILAGYVEQGGKALALHNGIIVPAGSRIEQVYGGNFVTHPPYTLLQYQWEGKEDFSMEEEPYMVKETDDQNAYFLWFVYEGKSYPAGWYRKFGKGRCCFLAPGHDQQTAEKKMFQRLLRECVQGLME